MRNILVNSIVERTVANGNVTVDRVLWIDPQGVSCALFDLAVDQALPVYCDLLELRIELQAGTARLLEFDEYAALAVTDKDIPDNYRMRRDQA